MEGFKCTVTGATSTTPLGTPKPAVWCEDDPSKCVSGPKQMLIWNQAEGNNIEVEGYDLAGSHKSPAYNAKCGFKDGAYRRSHQRESLVLMIALGKQARRTTYLRRGRVRVSGCIEDEFRLHSRLCLLWNEIWDGLGPSLFSDCSLYALFALFVGAVWLVLVCLALFTGGRGM